VIRSTEYSFPGPASKCSASGRELKAGDRYFAALFERAGRFEREDYAESAWTGAPTGAIASWTGRIRNPGLAKTPKIDDDRLFECFDRLANTTEASQRNFRYVAVLLLVRRKKLKLEDSRKNPLGEDVLVLTDSRSGKRCEVIDPKLTEAEAEAVQADVFRVLG